MQMHPRGELLVRHVFAVHIAGLVHPRVANGHIQLLGEGSSASMKVSAVIVCVSELGSSASTAIARRRNRPGRR